MGTRSTTLAGRAKARKIGTTRYAGVARRVRKRRRSSRTSREMKQRAKVKKMLDPTETGDTETDNMVRVGKRVDQPLVMARSISVW